MTHWHHWYKAAVLLGILVLVSLTLWPAGIGFASAPGNPPAALTPSPEPGTATPSPTPTLAPGVATPPPPPPVPIPEPATLFLVGSGLAALSGLAAFKRKRRAND